MRKIPQALLHSYFGCTTTRDEHTNLLASILQSSFKAARDTNFVHRYRHTTVRGLVASLTFFVVPTSYFSPSYDFTYSILFKK